VLNKYGVGTMKSLLAGLQAIPNVKRPTIINCSLMMAVRSSTLIRDFSDWGRLVEAEPDPKTQRFTRKQLRMPLNTHLAALMQPLEKMSSSASPHWAGTSWSRSWLRRVMTVMATESGSLRATQPRSTR
jgi:hypothetical protein